MTLGAYSTFGKVAVTKGNRRAASVISNAFTELMILSKSSKRQEIGFDMDDRHDLSNKLDNATKKKLEEQCETYHNDIELLNELIDSLKWEQYKTDLVEGILVEQNKERYLIQHTERYNENKTSKTSIWKP